MQGIYTRIHDRGQKGQGVELVWGAGKGWARREEVEGLDMEEVLGGRGQEVLQKEMEECWRGLRKKWRWKRRWRKWGRKIQ